MQTYKLKTIKDIQKAVNEDNLEGFLQDFREFLKVSMEFDAVIGLFGGKQNTGQMTWNDDGEWGKLKKITIKVKKVK